jgi:hypothetical protein
MRFLCPLQCSLAIRHPSGGSQPPGAAMGRLGLSPAGQVILARGLSQSLPTTCTASSHLGSVNRVPTPAMARLRPPADCATTKPERVMRRPFVSGPAFRSRDSGSESPGRAIHVDRSGGTPGALGPSQLCSRDGWTGVLRRSRPTCLLAVEPAPVVFTGDRSTSAVLRRTMRRRIEVGRSRGRQLGFWVWPVSDPCPPRLWANRCCLGLCLSQGSGRRAGVPSGDHVRWIFRPAPLLDRPAIGSRPPLPAPIRSWV